MQGSRWEDWLTFYTVRKPPQVVTLFIQYNVVKNDTKSDLSTYFELCKANWYKYFYYIFLDDRASLVLWSFFIQLLSREESLVWQRRTRVLTCVRPSSPLLLRAFSVICDTADIGMGRKQTLSSTINPSNSLTHLRDNKQAHMHMWRCTYTHHKST